MDKDTFWGKRVCLFLCCWMVCCGVLSARSLSLQCEYMDMPLCIDMTNPRLMWQINTTAFDVKQQAFRVLVASSSRLLKEGKADYWDSGICFSDAQLVVYQGNPLQSHSRYWWKVEVWDGKQWKYSGKSWFETAKLNPGAWQAYWITDGRDKETEPAPYFRKEFFVDGKVENARLYVSGLGYYESYFNGIRVDNTYLHPGFTDYGKRVLYGVHDVTSLLKHGNNCLGICLGNGWFNEQTPTVWLFNEAPWRRRPQLLCELRIRYVDGREQLVYSDDTWHTSLGPLLFDNIHVGVIYDARLEQVGWNCPGFVDATWRNAIVTTSPASVIESHKMPVITLRQRVRPISVRQVNDTCLIFNMGVNAAGVVRLRVRGERGTCIRLRHAELQDVDGMIDQRNIQMHLRPRTPKEVIQRDVYVLKGEGWEEFMPTFTYHGFQYVELTSSRPVSPKDVCIEGQLMNSGVEEIGSFECSDTLVNRIFEICRRSYLSNLFGIPTDCPTREKNGWMADGFMVQEAGMLSYDSRNIYAKWVRDMKDAQQANGDLPGIVPTSWRWDSNWAGPIWDAAIFIVPSLLYRYSGDLFVVKEAYPVAAKYLDFLATTEDNRGLIKHGLGDWLYYQAVTSSDFMVSCYYYHDNVLMARMAHLLGKNEDERKYREKAKRLRKAIQTTYFDESQLVYANGTQLSYALPLYLEIAPEAIRKKLASKLNRLILENDCQLDFGFIGSLVVPDVLADYGYADTMYKILTSKKMPSWGYWIDRYGATSLFETWDIERNIGDASRNHPSMGAVAAWMYKALAGIGQTTHSVAFKHIVIRPYFVEGLNWVKSSYLSQQGLIVSEWERKGNQVTLRIVIPAGADAKVFLPNRSPLSVGSGKYRWTVSLSN